MKNGEITKVSEKPLAFMLRVTDDSIVDGRNVPTEESLVEMVAEIRDKNPGTNFQLLPFLYNGGTPILNAILAIAN